ncbi:MAG: hypothetical protein C4519_24285 [Desulfobacteraceae bacterium]|nr:MAG: hypothetical protein C4519_24285 [Desulfobacteraceae bacterium]
MHKEGFNTRILQKKLQGEAAQHQQKLSSVIFGLFNEPDFYSVFYPIFKRPPDYTEIYLIPDYCLIRKRDSAYKIEFGEVEVSDKPRGYTEEKQAKYEQVAKDGNTYHKWWAYHAGQLGLPMCSIDNFCFSVAWRIL